MANNPRITVNISNAIKETSLEKYAPIVSDIHNRIMTKTIEGHEFFGFLNPLRNVFKMDVDKIKLHAKRLIDEEINVLLVIAGKHIALQAEALINLSLPKLKDSKSKPLEIIFVDDYLEGRDLAMLIDYLSTKSFAINVISQNSENLESIILFREFRYLLEREIGKKNAAKYIFVTTNNNYGYLFEETRENDFEHFILLDNTTEKFMSYSAAILFPLACSKINIDKVLEGAVNASEIYGNDDLLKNDAYRYALTKYIFYKNGYKIENLNVFSKSDYKLGELFKMYASETCIKQNKGILPLLSQQPSDTKCYGQALTETEFKLFDTVIQIQRPQYDYAVMHYQNHHDNIVKNITKLSYNKINNVLIDTFIENHKTIYKIPHIKIEIANDNDETFGWILCFLHYNFLMSAYLMGNNPFISNAQNSFNINFKKNIKDI
ncbi:Glucose-6-phosphate isomerase [Metamycoplasma cloacale]|uniref:Glucose-6-phosphate isomerase n=1 Tax=Metamycoplasma cloacale TaxID=92401 RepID=A0A2Z4LMG1_9BACT|nr:hypothetical protein [Metamycoplasma cloacale]AWX42949.1 glucose-6-phosphate isomerase [Metamycoplasma cloacale]VEU79227.1 Glucose-6-phosphate isomerase [Metamycoplasma cloacale]